MANVSSGGGLADVAPLSTPPEDYLRVQASPESFGAGIGRGLEKFGQGAGDAGQFFAQVATDNAFNDFQTQARRLLYGDPTKTVLGPDGQPAPDTGYMGLRGRAALDARPSLENQLDSLIKETRSSLPTAQQQISFDRDSRRYRTYLGNDIASHADQQANHWYMEVAKTQGQLALDHIGTAAVSDEQFNHGLSDLVDAKVKQAQLLGANPADPNDPLIQDAHISATREGLETRIKALAPKDPQLALKVLNDNASILSSSHAYDGLNVAIGNQVVAQFQGLARSAGTDRAYAEYEKQRDALPAVARDRLEGWFADRRDRDLTRAIMVESRNDALAQRHLREVQASTYGKVWADTMQGNAPDNDAIAEMVRTQRLTPEMARAVTKGAGQTDDISVLNDLESRARHGDDIMSDVTSAADNGSLKASTVARLINVSTARRQRQEDAVEKAAFSQLKTIAGGDAVEKGLVDFSGEAKSAQIQLWGQAQAEYNERVFLKHEDPWQVYGDMKPRYEHPVTTINALPAPRVGRITSIDDVPKIAQATKDAHDAGRMDESTYQAEQELIVRYKALLDHQRQREQAAKGPKQLGKGAKAQPNE